MPSTNMANHYGDQRGGPVWQTILSANMSDQQGEPLWWTNMADQYGGPVWQTIMSINMSDQHGGPTWRTNMADHYGGPTWRTNRAAPSVREIVKRQTPYGRSVKRGKVTVLSPAIKSSKITDHNVTNKTDNQAMINPILVWMKTNPPGANYLQSTPPISNHTALKFY